MAKWGEGDPRWLVQDLGNAGTNVNGWHWQEKCVKAHVQHRLGELFADLPLEVGGKGSFKLTFKEATGDASITTRKGGKRFPVYDLKVTINWEGQLANGTKEVKGDIKVEEFATASDAEDYVFTVNATGSGAEVDNCKKVVESSCKALIIKQLHQLLTELNQL